MTPAMRRGAGHSRDVSVGMSLLLSSMAMTSRAHTPELRSSGLMHGSPMALLEDTVHDDDDMEHVVAEDDMSITDFGTSERHRDSIL